MKTVLTKISGSTLIETLVTVGVVTIAGAGFFVLLETLGTLASKNYSIDYAHENGRSLLNLAIDRLHASASTPMLVDATDTQITGNGPAAGVQFETVVLGPVKITNNNAATSTSVQIQAKLPYDPDTRYLPYIGASGTPEPITSSATPRYARRAGSFIMSPTAPVPVAGMRFFLPGFGGGLVGGLEWNITAATGSWSNYPSASYTSPTSSTSGAFTLTLSSNLGYAIDGTGTVNYIGYVTQRSLLIASNGNLMYYPNVGANGAPNTGTPNFTSTPGYVVARNITNRPLASTYASPATPPTAPVAPTPAAPFSYAGSGNRYIQVAFSSREPVGNSRGFKAINFSTLVTVSQDFSLTAKQY